MHWSSLICTHEGSAAKDGNDAEDRCVYVEGNQQTGEHRTIQRIGEMNISVDKNATGMPGYQGTYPYKYYVVLQESYCYLPNRSKFYVHILMNSG